MFLYNYDNLKEKLNTREGEKYFSVLEKYYELNYKGKPIYALPYYCYKAYYITGDRFEYQSMYFSRRERLMLLQILALKDDKYLDALEEILAAVCDEFTWVVPAHNHIKSNNSFDYSVIDLFASETGMYLSETCYVFNDKLSTDIKNRIYNSVYDKIIKNYESRTFSWENRKTNWSAVCACGIGLCYLYLFPEKFDNIKSRLFESFRCYLSGINEDGYISEGYYYWMYGFGFFTLFYDVYSQLVSKEFHPYNQKIIDKILKFAQNSLLSDSIALPFADGGSIGEHTVTGLLCTIERVYNVNLFLDKKLYNPAKKALGFRVLLCLNKPDVRKTYDNKTLYYPNSQIFIKHNDNFAFAVKGGDNDEIHNHNDIGTFCIVKNDKQIIADIGVGKYTRGFFDDVNERYGDEIFVCSSLAHSVPVIDGKPQSYGKKYHATVLNYFDNEFTLDISAAYDSENQKVIVSYILKEDGLDVEYDCRFIRKNVIFRFVSFVKPKLLGSDVFIDKTKIIDYNKCKAEVKQKKYLNAANEETTVYLIDYTIEKSADFKVKFTFKI